MNDFLGGRQINILCSINDFSYNRPKHIGENKTAVLMVIKKLTEEKNLLNHTLSHTSVNIWLSNTNKC